MRDAVEDVFLFGPRPLKCLGDAVFRGGALLLVVGLLGRVGNSHRSQQGHYQDHGCTRAINGVSKPANLMDPRICPCGDGSAEAVWCGPLVVFGGRGP